MSVDVCADAYVTSRSLHSACHAVRRKILTAKPVRLSARQRLDVFARHTQAAGVAKTAITQSMVTARCLSLFTRYSDLHCSLRLSARPLSCTCIG